MTLHHRHTVPRVERSVSANFGSPMVGPESLYRAMGKRMLDLGLIALFGIPALVIVLILALFISRDGASPFYLQERIGRNGERFWMWKLRSMVTDAETQLDAHLAENPSAREEWDLKQKLHFDPRVTPIGRFIRKTSLDELPQLLNVLKGDMSLVGPRPIMVNQRALYPGTAYYEMRPGITGYWQTSARNESSFAERATFDTAYYRDLSFSLDLLVLLRSIRVVVQGTGC